MLKKKIILVLSAISLTTTVTVFGATIKKDLAVYVNNIKVMFDFKELNLKDARGDSVEPLVINDSVYLPLRAIAESLDVKVDWRDEIKAVYLSRSSGIIICDDGLYEGELMVGGTYRLGNKICDITPEWAAKTNEGNLLISDYEDADEYNKIKVFNIVDLKGNKIETVLSTFAKTEIYSFDGETLYFGRYSDTGMQHFEIYEYAVNIKSKEIMVSGFTPSIRENLGYFNGDVEAFEEYKQTRIDSEQARLDELEDFSKF